MYFLALSVLSLAIAVLPWKISLLGRVLGLLSAAWCWVYGSAVLAGRAPLGVGALGNFVGLDPSPWSGEGVTAGLGFLLALLAAMADAFGSGFRLAVGNLYRGHPRPRKHLRLQRLWIDQGAQRNL
jgi:hypothetical protein